MNEPIVTALLPVWTGEEYIEETIMSIRNQTFSNWEMLIIAEPGVSPALKEIGLRQANEDKRITYMENELRLGLAESLNKGIELAIGKYIARVDADDPSHSSRFEKQVRYLDIHHEVGILGSQVERLTPNGVSISEQPVEPELIKTEMLFNCCFYHSTLMFRRELFSKNNWRYPADCAAEDYSLWLSVLNETVFANIDEPLVVYRVGFESNISFHKGKALHNNAHELIAEAIQTYLNIDTRTYDLNRFICAHEYAFTYLRHNDLSDLGNWISDIARILLEMENANIELSVFANGALAYTLRKRWNWMLNGCFVFDFVNEKCALSHLPVNSHNRFSADLVSALNKAELMITGTYDVDEIVSAVRSCAVAYETLLSNMIYRYPKVVIFGIGYYCNKFFEEISDHTCIFDLVAFCDNDKNKSGKYGKPVVSPNLLKDMDYDLVLISSRDYYSEMQMQLINVGILPEKIWPLEIFLWRKP